MAIRRNAPAAAPRKQNASNGKTQQQQNTSNNPPFLTVAHIDGDTQLVIGDNIRLYTGGQYGDNIIVRVAADGGAGEDPIFDWSIKIGKQAFLRLEKKLGKNLLQWPGKSITVRVAQFNGNDYIEVVE